MRSYNSSHAKLAASGVNILNVVPIDEEQTTVLFEYSWKDPEQEGKLHWSKTMLTVKKEDKCPVDDLIMARVNLARKELERGE